MPERPLSTTAYALLGLLSLRPWSAYDLTAQVRRSLAYVWPRSESHLYDEPKRLVTRGLARVRTEHAGRRSRAVYEITGAGRDALRAWLATEPSPPQFQLEVMLRLLFADQGTKRELLDALEATAAEARRLADAGRGQCAEYLDTGGPFPERLHLIALFADFYGELFDLLDRWCERARTEVDSWPSTRDLGMTGGGRAMLQRVVREQPARPPRRVSGKLVT